MTRQLQEAPGRMVETRCWSNGIDHSFLHHVLYTDQLRPHGVRVKHFQQGEGAVNSLGGLRPDTVQANITGSLTGFWHLLDDGYVRNWNGEVRLKLLACILAYI
jgi:hypothetical protein